MLDAIFISEIILRFFLASLFPMNSLNGSFCCLIFNLIMARKTKLVSNETKKKTKDQNNNNNITLMVGVSWQSLQSTIFILELLIWTGISFFLYTALMLDLFSKNEEYRWMNGWIGEKSLLTHCRCWLANGLGPTLNWYLFSD